jgi:hypothetical protein
VGDALISLAAGLLAKSEALFSRELLRHAAKELGVDVPPSWNDPSFPILVAAFLSPRSALCYEPLDPRPRWTYIRDYLRVRTNFSEDELEAIGRTVAAILDGRNKTRVDRPGDFERLMSSQSGLCAICRLPFHGVSRAVRDRDPFRPLWLAPLELTKPEIDHIEPFAWSGRSHMENLQLLCRACNAAKSDGLRITALQEAGAASLSLQEVPRIHLFRLLVWLANRHSGVCQLCGSNSHELTMRLVENSATLLRANLRLVCYQCTPDHGSR